MLALNERGLKSKPWRIVELLANLDIRGLEHSPLMIGGLTSLPRMREDQEKEIMSGGLPPIMGSLTSLPRTIENLERVSGTRANLKFMRNYALAFDNRMSYALTLNKDLELA